MGVVEERAGALRQDQFEELARYGDRVEESLRLEFINGKVREKAMPDGDHDTIIEWLTRRCIQADQNWWLYAERGLRVESYRKGNARPDGTLAPSGAFAGQGEWASPDDVLMVVEVTSYDSDTDQRDRQEKPVAYAQAEIPVYLLIDREVCEVTVYSEPEGGKYGRAETAAFGKTVTLPDPVGMELDTEPLKAWVR
ncbi:Uma2 family endonuclease [Streptomyces sp. NPDC089799]|uniref:Uma2 family endonuclease n=1 Tax=Streptomyces sp. NPDC089799 TaxID=3155066 RepID=UPI003434FE58